MSQHDYILADAAGAAFRADLNLALAAIVQNNSGATEPATMYAYQFWADTTSGLLKQRNAANAAWITLGTMASAYLGLLPLTGGTVTGDTTLSGIVTLSGTIAGATPFVFEGATANAFETSFAITDPTADRTVTFPDADVDLTKVRAASETLDGVVELATTAEVVTGTDTTRAVTAAGVAAAIAAIPASSGITLATMQATTSGSTIDFTGIPAGTKHIAVMLSSVAAGGAGYTLGVQLGDAGGVESTGYVGGLEALYSTSQFQIFPNTFGGGHSGVIHLYLVDAATFLWAASGNIASTTISPIQSSAGSKALSAELDRVRLMTSGTFSAGNVNISYE